MAKIIDKMRKQYISKSEVDDEDRTVTAVITTDAVDRDKEVVLPKGADIEQYMTNPVVQWAHQYDEAPIGKTLWINKQRNKITAKVKFPTEDVSTKGAEIYNLFKGGYLNAFSIGFIPKSSHAPTPKEIVNKPEWAEAHNIIDEWELLEFSAVPVPANPQALATAVKSKAVTISDDLKTELGIEDEPETKVWAATDDNTDGITTWELFEETEKATATNEPPVKEPVAVKPLPMKQVKNIGKKYIKVRGGIDVRAIADYIKAMLKGKVY